MSKHSFVRRLCTAALCGAGLLAAALTQAADIPVSGYLTGTNNWWRTNIYTLNGMVFVRSNGVLNIEAGTVIKGHNLGTFSTNVAALVVCRGGKIFAEGTPQNPIIFTADVDDTTFPDDLDIYQRGLWGGLVILGRTEMVPMSLSHWLSEPIRLSSFSVVSCASSRMV